MLMHSESTAFLTQPREQDPSRRGALNTQPAQNARISIVVIFKNNAGRVAHTLAGVARLLEAIKLYGAAELILIDDSSTDSTFGQIVQAARELKRFRCRILQSSHGFGDALRIGLAATTGSILCTIDGAATYEPTEMLKLIDIMHTTGCDVVTGSPYHPWTVCPRRLLSKWINRVYRFLVPGDLYCFTCFFRVYKRERIAGARLFSDGYIGNTELLIDLARRGATIVEYPLSLGKPGYGDTPRQTLEIIRDHLCLIARIFFSRERAEQPARKSDLARFALTGRTHQH